MEQQIDTILLFVAFQLGNMKTCNDANLTTRTNIKDGYFLLLSYIKKFETIFLSSFFITTCLHLEQRKGVIWTHKGMCEKNAFEITKWNIFFFSSPLLFKMLSLF